MKWLDKNPPRYVLSFGCAANHICQPNRHNCYRETELDQKCELVYQFWIHATWIPKLGWLEYVLNTPSSHRVHHAANLEYLDANYGGVLIVFDRLFGTYIPERDDVPCRYGLVHPMTSYNPLHVEFAQWISLARDLAKARSARAVLGYLFMPPGWSPEGNGETTEELRARRAQSAGVTSSSLLQPSPIKQEVA